MSAQKSQQLTALIDLQDTAQLARNCAHRLPIIYSYGQRVAYKRAEVDAWALGSTPPSLRRQPHLRQQNQSSASTTRGPGAEKTMRSGPDLALPKAEKSSSLKV